MHEPVLVQEALKYFDPQPGQNFVDATLGDGGHAEAILKRTVPDGMLLGVDADRSSIERAGRRLAPFGKRVICIYDNFRHLETVVQKSGIHPIHGILLDLGWSSSQREESGRGFTFTKDEPLDMRLDTHSATTAAHIVNSAKEAALGDILRVYGEERLWRPLARAIVAQRRKRKFKTTQDLVACIEAVFTSHGLYRRGRIHPATRTFQALRIAVNDELGALRAALPQALRVLAHGGRIAVISFHSLEDRIVKKFFRSHADHLRTLTKKPITPTREEVAQNPRARSARLRAAQKV